MKTGNGIRTFEGGAIVRPEMNETIRINNGGNMRAFIHRELMNADEGDYDRYSLKIQFECGINFWLNAVNVCYWGDYGWDKVVRQLENYGFVQAA